MITLRPYQTQLIDKVREQLRQHNSVVMVLPTGGGKTLTTGWMLARAAERGKTCIFTVHRVELLGQTEKAFKALGMDCGIIASNQDYVPGHRIYIASIDTLRRRLDQIPAPDLLVLDEAHKAMCDTWVEVINAYPTAKKLLITATPERLDGKGLIHVAQSLVEGVNTRWLIDNGFLAPYKLYTSGTKPDLQGVRTTGGDYNIGDLATAMDKAAITGDAIAHYQRHGQAQQAIVFAVNIEHSRSIAAQFQAAGIEAAHLDGGAGKIEREGIVEQYRSGDIRVLCNVNLFTEGFDVPSAGVCIMLRPTKSLSLYLQMAGRVLRPMPGKTAIILDHAGNVHQHAAPSAVRSWSLEGRKGRKLDKHPPLHECEVCYFNWEGDPKVCPECGHVKEVEERKGPQLKDGDLEELTPDSNPWAWAASRSLASVMPKVKTMEDLKNLCKAKGYKPGWVFYKAKDIGLIRA